MAPSAPNPSPVYALVPSAPPSSAAALPLVCKPPLPPLAPLPVYPPASRLAHVSTFPQHLATRGSWRLCIPLCPLEPAQHAGRASMAPLAPPRPAPSRSMRRACLFLPPILVLPMKPRLCCLAAVCNVVRIEWRGGTSMGAPHCPAPLPADWCAWPLRRACALPIGAGTRPPLCTLTFASERTLFGCQLQAH